jgi:cytochrome c biogenesis protein CcdA
MLRPRATGVTFATAGFGAVIEVLSLILLGLFLGMRHATDPDHVIAVSTIVSRQPTIRAALLIGSLWGVGHTLTIVAVGGGIVVFTIVIPPRLGLTMEMAVAIMLIVLGMWNLSEILDQIRRFGSSGTAGARQPEEQSHSHRDSLGGYQLLRPLVVGLVHGLSGSAAVALLVLALIRNPWWAIAYLMLFGIGTIAGMMLITAAIGATFACASQRSPRVERWVRFASGVLSLGFGLFLAYQIAVVDGLITGSP